MDGGSSALILLVGIVVALFVLTAIIATTFLRSVDAGEILLVSWLGRKGQQIFRGPKKAFVVPIFTQVRSIPAQAINVDIEITDQTADLDVTGRPAPVKVTVRASAIVSVGEDEGMVNTAANKFFSKGPSEQLSTLTDVLSSAGRRAINLLKHDQLFNIRTSSQSPAAALAVPLETAIALPSITGNALVARGDDDELAVIIKDACSRELLDLGLSFNSLNIKAVLSEVAEARRRESAARAKASADVVQAQEEQRSRIAQLEAQQKVNDQERNLNMQIAANGASIARAEAEKQAAFREQREAELNASQITKARADAEQNVIQQEAEGRAQAARIRAIAEAEAGAIRAKAQALAEAGQAYFDLRRLELAPALTREVAAALANGQFINFGSTGAGGQSAAASGSDDVLRVVQTLIAAQAINLNGPNNGNGANGNGNGNNPRPLAVPDDTEIDSLTGGLTPRPTVPAVTKNTFRK